ncbi:MAG: RHS repeat-associated core domain-containing protein [Deltaproteobacteria bacterium]|nr:RHS repeat-associated core domain-containing protein [Deltaproteobacteria bacterium]
MNLRLPGQYYDEESGLHYNWHRYYDPKIGRYLTPDHLIGSIMPYEYANSNPLGFIDGNGLDEMPLPSGANLIGGLAGQGIDAACDDVMNGFNPDDPNSMPSAGCENFKGMGLGEKADEMVEQGVSDLINSLIFLCGVKAPGKAPRGPKGTPSQAADKVARDQGPRGIGRIDPPTGSNPNSQWHAHSGSRQHPGSDSINVDGTTHHGNPLSEIPRRALQWLRDHGWDI